MDTTRREPRHVTGHSPELGGSGDPSAATAYGLLYAMKAVATRLWGDHSLEGRHVCVSGVGKVGSRLVKHLVDGHAKVTVADVNPAAVERMAGRYGVDPTDVDTAHAVACDIFSPCA